MSGRRVVTLRQREYSRGSRAGTVWFGWFEFAMVNMCNGPNCASIGLARDALIGVKHNSTLLRAAQARMAGVLLADRLSMIT